MRWVLCFCLLKITSQYLNSKTRKVSNPGGNCRPESLFAGFGCVLLGKAVSGSAQKVVQQRGPQPVCWSHSEGTSFTPPLPPNPQCATQTTKSNISFPQTDHFGRPTWACWLDCLCRSSNVNVDTFFPPQNFCLCGFGLGSSCWRTIWNHRQENR